MALLLGLDPSGHKEYTWESTDPVSVAAARAAYDAYERGGYIQYERLEGGGRGRVLRAFEPDLEQIVAAPAMQGG